MKSGETDFIYAEVIVDISNSEVDRIFDYEIGDLLGVLPGKRVMVPFGSRQIEGYVIRLKNETALDTAKIKKITSVLDAMPVILPEMLMLGDYMVKKYHLRTADAFRLFIPSQMRSGRIKELTKIYISISPEYRGKNPSALVRPSARAQLELLGYLNGIDAAPQSELNVEFSASALRNLLDRGILTASGREVLRRPYGNPVPSDKAVCLTEGQQAAVKQILSAKDDTFLLHGVTGSGKTEVYMTCISDALERGKTAIMLVPEIALTPQVLRIFRSRFGENVAILHSGLSAGERFDEWRRLLRGEARVVIGARSAIFAPVKNIGIIIVDEEHEDSYLSESNPRFHALDIAAFRSSHNGCSLILGSATPSVESYQRAVCGEYRLIEMAERVNKKPLPEMVTVNMCEELYAGNSGIFSRALIAELKTCIANGNQAMLFINRRGYSSYVICRSCGYVAKCGQCDVSLAYHKEDDALKCHFCSARYAPLDICPECKGPHIRQGFVGTERVVETLLTMFPQETILRMDADTTKTKDSHADILERFAKEEARILVGTQMIAKGHDFPSVTLVGILDADMSLHFSDYRSIERTYQLITQVSGRAGRENKAGKVILQTYTPHHYVYKFASSGNYKAFFEKEKNLREVTKFPPFSKIIRILFSGEHESTVAEILKSTFHEITELSKIKEYAGLFAYLAAMRSPVKRIQNKYRMQIIMRITGEEDVLTEQIFTIADKYKNPYVSCFVEQNPLNMR